MPKMFKSKDADSISYFKMYSTFKNQTIKDCVAFILMPSSQQRHRVSLQSLQFDFNECGKILMISFIYTGHELDIQKKVDETMNGIAVLRRRYGLGEASGVFRENNTLKLGLIDSDPLSYMADNIDFIKNTYHIKADFAQDIKSQLTNQVYLAQEFIRLRGKVPEKTPGKAAEQETVCLIM
ncbi:hypothetical protein [Legionella maioricensis]|uniref:Uncharacterized protein n=1 Tax=Legionella maioricensis TaxID=2896528 RepID=A0A9X2D2I4_9GAMM|nr:hypothetical protein [Legionella maioricensis]MCL9685124.1 hypothetical protein [Legionella maioricensis]MCL9688363.1 hypothetical protein [Legionella maioricensis]